MTRLLASLSMLLLSGGAAICQVSFQAPLAFEDKSPQQVLEADFNHDGRLDILAIDLFSTTLFLNEGKGHFSAGQPLPGYSGCCKMAVLGDFNKDGNIDIAVLEYPTTSNAFYLLLGNGDGTFRATTPVTTQTSPQVILAGDFFGHGKLDVAVINTSIQVFPGNGDGTFGMPLSTPISLQPSDAVAADFNGDHKLDIAIGTLNTTSAYIYTGNGDGTFAAGATLPLGGAAVGLTAADVNRDGKQDLLASVNSTVTVLLGNGNGTFQTPVPYALPRVASNTAVADVNHDGIPDLVVACWEFDLPAGGAISVLFGNGDGTFQAAINSEVGTDARTLTVGDFNGDGQLDVAFTEDFSTDLAFGTGGGHFTQAAIYHVAIYPSQVFAANFLAKGVNDIVSLAQGTMELFAGAGNGKFGKPVRTNIPGFYAAIGTVADFNGDGIPDLAAAGSTGPFGGTPNGLAIYFGGTGAKLTPGPAYTKLPFNVTSLAAADLNGDGIVDLVLTCDIPNSYVVALGTGGGNFKIGKPVPVSYGLRAAAIGDFNRDGKADLIVADGGNVYILTGKGDGNFQPPVALSLPSISPLAVAAGDLNGDGKLDVVAAGTGFQACALLGNGDGTFQPAVCETVGQYSAGVAVADFDQDGKLDVATVNYDGNAISILLGKGDGTFFPAINFAVGEFPNGFAVADLNGDGKPDLVTANSFSDTLSVLLNTTGLVHLP